MPRDCVYQLRLTKAEKDELGERARRNNQSIAQVIREALNLGWETVNVGSEKGRRAIREMAARGYEPEFKPPTSLDATSPEGDKGKIAFEQRPAGEGSSPSAPVEDSPDRRAAEGRELEGPEPSEPGGGRWLSEMIAGVPNVSVEQLTQQFKNQGYTTPVAERMARERLS